MLGPYLLGLATLPTLGLLYLLGRIATEGPGRVWVECRYCRWSRYPGRRPWWLWRAHKEREWHRHMRLSHTCREKLNAYNERNGVAWRFDVRGRRVEVEG